MYWNKKSRRIVSVYLLLTLIGCSVSVPTPNMTPGQVKGVLLNTSQQPVTGVTVGLLRIARSGDEAQNAVATPQSGVVVQRYITINGEYTKVVDTGIKTKTDNSGVFFFDSVPPGKYTLYAQSTNQPVIKDDKGEPIVFELLPGQVVDLTIQLQQ
ncbi:MAG: carboxypeptidase-like regulatory domain-containing protein [Chloroflexota bacterium]